ncbi:MAG: molybdenum cofactor guanylyltransferase [Pyrinomonadaceae bacterium]
MSIDAYVLIGGRSSRLGRDKAAIKVGGLPLAVRAAQTVGEALPEARVSLVAGHSGQFGGEASFGEFPLLFDLVEGRGPIGGLHAALSNARTDWIFVLACDYPFVSPVFLKLLGGMISDEFEAVAPEQPDGLTQPLCAFYRKDAIFPIIDRNVKTPRSPPPLYRIISGLHTRTVRYEEYSHLPGCDELFININTQQDLEKLREIEDRPRRKSSSL